MNARACRAGHRRFGCWRARRFRTRCSPRCTHLPVDDREALLGPAISDAGVFRADARPISSAHLSSSAPIAARNWSRELSTCKRPACSTAAIGVPSRISSSCISTSAITRRSSIASSAGCTRFEPGAGGEYKWLRGFDPALTRSMHFIAHPGFARRWAISSSARAAKYGIGSRKAANAASSSLLRRLMPKSNRPQPRALTY